MKKYIKKERKSLEVEVPARKRYNFLTGRVNNFLNILSKGITWNFKFLISI